MNPTRIIPGVIVLILLVSGGLSGLSLSVEPTGGTLFGVAKEFVYDQNVATNYKLSELDWHFQPIVYYGVDVKLATKIGIVVGVSAKSGISGRTGIMEDSDFQNGTIGAGGQEVKTLYSQSDNYLENALLVHANVGYRFKAGGGFSITPLAAVHYMNMKWTARDGYTQYPITTSGESGYYFDAYGRLVPGNLPAWSSNLPETPLSGPAVVYRQEYLVPAAAVQVSWVPVKPLEVSASIAYSPLVFAQTVDDHVMRQLTFTDTFSGGTYVQPTLDIRYRPNDRFGVRLGASYTMITGLVGKSTWQNDGSTQTFPQVQYLAGGGSGSSASKGGGASYDAWDILVAFRVSM